MRRQGVADDEQRGEELDAWDAHQERCILVAPRLVPYRGRGFAYLLVQAVYGLFTDEALELIRSSL